MTEAKKKSKPVFLKIVSNIFKHVLFKLVLFFDSPKIFLFCWTPLEHPFLANSILTIPTKNFFKQSFLFVFLLILFNFNYYCYPLSFLSVIEFDRPGIGHKLKMIRVGTERSYNTYIIYFLIKN